MASTPVAIPPWALLESAISGPDQQRAHSAMSCVPSAWRGAPSVAPARRAAINPVATVGHHAGQPRNHRLPPSATSARRSMRPGRPPVPLTRAPTRGAPSFRQRGVRRVVLQEAPCPVPIEVLDQRPADGIRLRITDVMAIAGPPGKQHSPPSNKQGQCDVAPLGRWSHASSLPMCAHHSTWSAAMKMKIPSR